MTVERRATSHGATSSSAPFQIDVFTLFPRMFAGPLDESILKRARERNLIRIEVLDIRNWTEDRHRTADDAPYGGGAGMVMTAPPVVSAVEAVKSAVTPSGIPVLGRVAAGEPLLAEENIEDYVQIPEIAGGEDGEYLLRVRGESMKNAGILPDDWVVVRRQDTAEDGEIVVALVGEEATVKRFFREADHVRLQPEN